MDLPVYQTIFRNQAAVDATATAAVCVGDRERQGPVGYDD